MRAAVLVCAVAIAWFALTPHGGAGSFDVPADKIAHFVAFYVLTLLMLAAFPNSRMVVLAAAMLAFGAAIEFVQAFVGRDAQWSDLVADAVGIACALAPAVIRKLTGPFRREPVGESPGWKT